MACTLTKGRTLSCQQAIGGIKRVYFSPWSKDYWTGLTYDLTDVYTIDDVTATTLQQYDTRPNLSQMTVTIANGDATAGTPAFYDQACDLVLQKLDVESLPYLKEVGDARTIVWVLDMNNKVWVLGLKHGARVTGGTLVTGTARGDMSGMTISISAQEEEPMFCVKWSASDTETTANYPFAQLSTPGNITIGAQVTPA
tara:strand:+ start:13925 stop:14518 length:594 start_codon:yes stop_codon:yes gene_type:complete